jgi:hypothetical protein
MYLVYRVWLIVLGFNTLAKEVFWVSTYDSHQYGESGAPVLSFTKFGANPRRIGDRLV